MLERVHMHERTYVHTTVQYGVVHVFKSWSRPCCLSLSVLLSIALTKIDLNRSSLDYRSFHNLLCNNSIAKKISRMFGHSSYQKTICLVIRVTCTVIKLYLFILKKQVLKWPWFPHDGPTKQMRTWLLVHLAQILHKLLHSPTIISWYLMNIT